MFQPRRFLVVVVAVVVAVVVVPCDPLTARVDSAHHVPLLNCEAT